MDHVVTLIAARSATPLRANDIDLVRNLVSGSRPIWLADAEAADILCAQPADEMAIRAALADRPIDVAVGPAADRRKSVLVADMDSTIVSSETLDDMAALAGFGDRVAAITRQSMQGEIDFAEALRLRVALLRGHPADLLEAAWRNVHLNDGAATLVRTMRAHGATTALVSGGFTWFTSRVAALCGFEHHHANQLMLEQDVLAGRVAEPILDRGAKLTLMRQYCEARQLPLTAALAVGDGANDLAMIEAAGLGVAYHGKPIVRQQARFRVDHGNLRALLFMQGYEANQFVD